MVIGVGKADNTMKPKDPQELCTPKQWEGFAASWYPELDTLALANVSYDFSNKKFAVDVKKVVFDDNDNHETKTYSMIFRFDKKKVYLFHDRPDGKNCSVKKLDHDFEEWCVPKDAKSMGPYTIGGKLEINAYLFNVTQSDADNSTWVYFESTSSGIPVGARYGNKKASGITDFYNITPGIDEPERFTPPDFCDDSKVTPWRHGHRGRRTSQSFNFWQFPYRV